MNAKVKQGRKSKVVNEGDTICRMKSSASRQRLDKINWAGNGTNKYSDIKKMKGRVLVPDLIPRYSYLVVLTFHYFSM